MTLFDILHQLDSKSWTTIILVGGCFLQGNIVCGSEDADEQQSADAKSHSKKNFWQQKIA